MSAPQPVQSPARLVTTRDRSLSLWQSAALETARRQAANAGEDTSQAALSTHCLVQGANGHAAAGPGHADEWHHPVEWLRGRETRDLLAHLSRVHLAHARALMGHDTGLVETIARHIDEVVVHLLGARRFSNSDLLGWANTEPVYIEYMTQTHGQKIYRDYRVAGAGKLTYGVCGYEVPADGRIAIIGDWGTGMNDAIAILTEILSQHRPSVILHLGDIYYSGTKEECSHNFADPINAAFNIYPAVPVLTIPGNHDYYAWGVGFYDMLDHKINTSNAAWRQAASYFCLRSADGKWQFLGMDTGISDGDPLDAQHPMSPNIRDSEKVWMLDKLSPGGFAGRTVLCSHNQVFSTRTTVNAPPGRPYLNDGLLGVFNGHLQQVAAWFWGHEHSLALYRNGLFGLAKGRLVGASAFEATQKDDPYEVVHPEVPAEEFGGREIRAGASGGFYNHSYAIVDLARKSPDDPISVSYYQMPSWPGNTPVQLPSDQPKLLATEALS